MRRILALIAGCLLSFSAHAAEKHVLLIAGRPSHGMGQHEHIAGVLLFQKCLASMPGLKVDVALGEWPKDRAVLDSADAVVLYADGGRNHLALADDHLAVLDALAAKGVGIGLIHYAIEPTQEKGEAEFLRWVGGCFEINWSINPAFNAKFDTLPTHPITRGVHPFSGQDEWYYHLRFVDSMKGITPLLVTTPGVDTLTRPDGPHEGNPAVRAAVAHGEPQTLAWAYERPNGGRGFGFAGGHYHADWANQDKLKLVLNGIVWLAKVEVPQDGVDAHVTADDLKANVVPRPKKK